MSVAAEEVEAPAIVRLGYRSLLSVPQDEEPEPIEAATAQLHSWLRRKRYDVDAMELDREVEIADGVTAALVRLDDRDGTASLRAHVVEVRRTGETWESELTVHAPGRSSEPASVLLDISGPVRPRAPRLAGLLTGVLPARDSMARLTDQPMKVGMADVETVAEAACDPERRGLLFVAGMTADLPYDQWYSYATGLLRETTGLASSYFLDPAATDAFREIMGDTHAVAPGTVRTFLPEADPASELDALRHRVLGTNRIVRDSSHRLALVLGRRAQEETLQADLPARVRRLQRRIAEHVDQLLLQPITEPNTPPVTELPTPPATKRTTEPAVEADTEPAAEQSIEAEVAPEEESAAKREPDAVASSRTDDQTSANDLAPVGTSARSGLERLVDRARAVVRRVLGVENPSDVHWEEVTELALRGKNAAAAQRGVARQLARLRDELDESDATQRDLHTRLQDEQLEHAATSEELDAVQRRNLYVEDLLRQSELVGELYADIDQPVSSPPQDFEELLSAAEDLEFVEFTGDADTTLALDQHDPIGVWAGKAWKILCALEDYGRSSRDGLCSADVEGYLRDVPPGCRGYSVNKHAATESEDVQNNRKFREARRLPVPPQVAGDHFIEMMAHFKIAQSGLISPRLHYCDDTTRTGKVYVGYIGPHLPTKRTN